jgi:hypothetical protein
VWSSNHAGVPGSCRTSKPATWFGCHAPMTDPPGSRIIAKLPLSATSIGGISTAPP